MLTCLIAYLRKTLNSINTGTELFDLMRKSDLFKLITIQFDE